MLFRSAGGTQVLRHGVGGGNAAGMVREAPGTQAVESPGPAKMGWAGGSPSRTPPVVGRERGASAPAGMGTAAPLQYPAQSHAHLMGMGRVARLAEGAAGSPMGGRTPTPAAGTPTVNTPPTVGTPMAETPTASTPTATPNPTPTDATTAPSANVAATQRPSKLTLSNWARPAGMSPPTNGVSSPPMGGLSSPSTNGASVVSPPLAVAGSPSINGTSVVSPPLNGTAPPNGIIAPAMSSQVQPAHNTPSMGLRGAVLPLDAEGRALSPIRGPPALMADDGIVAPAMASEVLPSDNTSSTNGTGPGGAVLPLDSEGRPLPPISGPSASLPNDGIVAPAMASPVQSSNNAAVNGNGLGLQGAVLPVDANGRAVAPMGESTLGSVSPPPRNNAPSPAPPVNGLELSGAVLPVDAQGRTIAVDELDPAEVKENGDTMLMSRGNVEEEKSEVEVEENPYFPTVSSIPSPKQALTSGIPALGRSNMDVATPMPTRKEAGRTPLAKPTAEKLAPKPVLDMVAPTPLPSGMNGVSIHGISGAGALSLDSPVEGSWMSTSPPGLVQGVPSPRLGLQKEDGRREATTNGDPAGVKGAAHTNGVERAAETDIAATTQTAENGVPAPPSLDGLTLGAEDEEEEEGKVMFPTSAKPDVNAVDSVSSYHAFLAQWCFARGEDAKEAAAARGT